MEANYVRMEDIAVITDFQELLPNRQFQQLESPETLKDYIIRLGGNFVFISNTNDVTVRFQQSSYTTIMNTLEVCVKKIKSVYPNF
jgi:hypothetical protein